MAAHRREMGDEVPRHENPSLQEHGLEEKLATPMSKRRAEDPSTKLNCYLGALSSGLLC